MNVNPFYNALAKSGERDKYWKVVAVFIFVSLSAFSQVGLHIKNYKGDVVFAKCTDNKIVAIETLSGYGLYVYSSGHLDKGNYLFLIGNKAVEFPLGEDQSFRIIADFDNSNIQNTVQITGSQDNSIFQEYLTKSLPRDKLFFLESHVKLVKDPFIRAYMQSLVSSVDGGITKGDYPLWYWIAAKCGKDK